MEDKDTGLHVAEGVISIGGDELTEEQQNVLEQVDRESKTRKFLASCRRSFWPPASSSPCTTCTPPPSGRL